MVQRIAVPLAVLFCALTPSVHASEVNVSGSEVFVFDSADESNVMSISRAGDVLTITDTANVTTDGDCNQDSATSVSCTVPGMVLKSVALMGGDDKLTLTGIGSDYVDVGAGDDTVTGSDLPDIINGEAGTDTIDGGGGNDQIDGGTGNDTLDGGAGDDFFWNNTGADVFTDTGGGRDSVSYFNNTNDANGVEVSLDNVANDGNLAEDGGTDNVSEGIDHIQGSRFADEIQGGAGADSLSGSDGNDTLTGNGGADSFNGGVGDDRIEAADGSADTAIDCDNSQGAHGAADVAIVDASDPAVANCETVTKAGASAGTGTGNSTATVTVISTDNTVEKAKMPDVVGKEIDAARKAVLARVAGVDLDVVFQKGCGQRSDLEVMRQRPAKGTKLTSFEGGDLPVRLYVCIAEKNFLGDCTLDGVRQDLKELPRSQDAEVALTITRKFATCKLDYDIKLSKQADEARVALAAQKEADAKNKRKAELKVGLSCPVTPAQQDLRVPITQGYNANPSGQLGLHAIDESAAGKGFTLPVTQAPFSSFVDLHAFDRNWQRVDATVYIDAEGAGIEQGNPGGTPRSLKLSGGYGRIKFTPTKPGKVKLCAVLETGDDQVLTYAIEIDVVAVKLGEIWPTVGGRRIKKVDGGWKDVSDEPVARTAGLGEIWEWITGLFGNRSRTINQTQAEASVSNAGKVKRVANAYSVGQIALDGTLDSNPVAPAIEDGTCVSASGAKVTSLRCKVVAARNNSALVGMSTVGGRIVAAGAGNVISHNGGQIVAAGAGNILSHNGAQLVGPDGASLVGPDGASLIGADGATAIGPALAQLVGPDGASLVGPDGASLVGPDGASLVGPDGAS